MYAIKYFLLTYLLTFFINIFTYLFTKYLSQLSIRCLHWLLENTLCLKNDTDVAHYNFNAHQLILVIFG